MIPFEALFSAPHRANFVSIAPIPHKAPDIVLEGLKMWSTELGLIMIASDFTARVGKLRIYHCNTQPIYPKPVCVYAPWSNVVPVTPQIRVYERFYVVGNKNGLSIRTVCERLTAKLKAAQEIRHELYRHPKPETLLLGTLSREVWTRCDGECWYDDNAYLYILVPERNKYVYKPYMSSEQIHAMILKAFTVSEFEVIKEFIDIAKAVHLIDLRR
jgi:hypothetical protein